MKKWTLNIVVILAVAVLVGCGKQEKESRGSVRTGRGSGITATGGTQPPAAGEPFKSTYGQFTSWSIGSVKKFISATMNPDTEMDLNDQNNIYGIAVLGDLRISGPTSNILALGTGTAQIASGSEFAMFIVDERSYGPQKVEAITIGFKPGQNNYNVSGVVSNNGQVQITFTDKYGDVYISGTVNSNTKKFSGTIDFMNRVVYSGGDASIVNRRFQLGSFEAPLCGIFHCQ